MLLSRNLLNKINPNFINVSNDELTTGFNAIGVEVEKILQIKVNEGLKLGKLIEFYKHPDSDHLNVCKVIVDSNELIIVCGAENLTINKYVVVAPIGYKLNDKFTITKRNIRGIESHGMLCGYFELISSSSQYLSKFDLDSIIMIDLNEDVNPNNFYDYLNLNDTIFELSIPSNRNELNGLYFLAYELNAYFKFNTKFKTSDLIVDNNQVQIHNLTDKLKSYSLLKLKLNDIYNQYSWTIKKYLVNCGIHSTNSIVDYGSYLTYLFANPVHMFDASKLESDTIVIKELEHDSQLIALDNKEYQIKAGSVVVCDNCEIISLIGLIGSKKYAVSNQTKNIYIEIANIDYKYINQYSHLNQISTNSTILFSKPLANEISYIAQSYAKDYLFKHLKVFNNIDVICIANRNKPNSININIDQINNLLGVNLTIQTVKEILALTGFKFENDLIISPAYRLDITNQFDITEEILRTLDINKFKTNPINFSILNFKNNQDYLDIQSIRNLLINHQFIETKTYNLVSDEQSNLFNWFSINNKIKIINPSSNNRLVLRHNLISQLLDVLVYNKYHNNHLANIFEIQKIQFDVSNSYNVLNLVSCVDNFNNVINKSKIKNDIYYVYSLFNAIIKLLNITNFVINKNVSSIENVYDKNNFEIKTKDNQLIGYIGEIKKTILNQYKLKNQSIYFICLNLDLLLSIKNKHNNKIISNSEFNPIYKEISFTNPHNIYLENVINDLKLIPDIVDINLYDYFDNNFQSYTISLQIKSYSKTLTQDEINEVLNKVISKLKFFNLEIRN